MGFTNGIADAVQTQTLYAEKYSGISFIPAAATQLI